MITRILVEDKLFEMGVDSTLKGFDFIIDAVMYLDSGMTEWGDIYKRIAKDYNVTESLVKRRLEIAITCTRDHVGNYDVTEKYFGFEEYYTTSSTLSRFYRRLRADEEIKAKKAMVTTIDEETIERIVLNVLSKLILNKVNA